MKKVIISTVLATVAFGLVAPSVLAKDLESKTTKGTIEFTVPSGNNDIILPDTEPPIVVTPPTGSETSTGTDGLNFTVPGFDFGKVSMSMLDETYHALPQEYTNKLTPATKYILPAMVIVRDARGIANGSWAMNVKASAFTSGATELKGATLKFVDPKGYNSNRTVPNQEIPASETIPGFLMSKGSLSITDTPKTFMSVKENALTAQTTYMFDKEGKYVITGNGTGVTNLPKDKGVKGADLDVPGAATKLKDVKYTANVVWTMTDTPDVLDK